MVLVRLEDQEIAALEGVRLELATRLERAEDAALKVAALDAGARISVRRKTGGAARGLMGWSPRRGGYVGQHDVHREQRAVVVVLLDWEAAG